MTSNMTKGSPAKLIFFFAIPFLIGNLFQQFYNIADTVIVGRTLGINALAAVGATGSFTWFAMGSIQGLTTGLSAVTAQRFGADDKKGVKKSFALSIVITAVYVLVLTLLCTRYSRTILEVLKTPEEIIEDAHGYLMWIFIGLFATGLFNLLSNMIRALGDSRTPLVFLVVACIINIILDIVLIVIFKMGPAGAGLATVIAQLLSGLLCVVFIAKKQPMLHLERSDFSYEKNLLLLLMQIGLPMAFLNMVLSIGAVIIQFVNNTLGTVYVATYGSASKIEQFITQPVLSFGSALAVFAAQNFGAHKFRRIIKGVNQCIGMCMIWAVIGAIIMILAGKLLMYAVAGGESQEVINNGYFYVVVNSICCVILVPIVIYKSVLQSVGRTFLPMVSGFVEIICRAGASILLSKMFGFVGVCFANPTAWLGGSLVVAVDYILMIRSFKKMGMDTESD